MALVTRGVVNACPNRQNDAILVICFIVGNAAVLMWKLGTRWSVSVYRGEWVYHTRSKAFKDKARLQPHSENFNFVILLNSFICKILKYEAGFILKLKVVCICYACLSDESLFT